MKIISKISGMIAEEITEQNKRDMDIDDMNSVYFDKEVYEYGISNIFMIALNIFLLLFVAFLLDTLLVTSIAFITYAVIRRYAGGYHMSSPLRCTIASILLLSVLGSGIEHVSWTPSVVFFILAIGFAFSFTMAVKYAPVDHPNRPIKKEDEIKLFRRRVFIIEAILMIISAIMFMFSYYSITMAITLGLLLESFTITPWGIKVFNKIDFLGRSEEIN